MKIVIEHVPDMTDKKQQEIGQALLVTLAYHKVEMQGIAARFSEES